MLSCCYYVYVFILHMACCRWLEWLVEDDEEDEEDAVSSDGSGAGAAYDSDDLLGARTTQFSLGHSLTEASITWARAFKSRGVQTIEDPLLETPVDKETYARIYGMPVYPCLVGSHSRV